MKKWLLRGLGALALVALLAFAFGYHFLRRSLPVVDGTVAVAGLTAPVEIVRDVDGIPHIRASNKKDALFGLGYVHAQDRLWQLEFQRRIGFGRLSEIFGAATIRQDRFLRTVGFGRAARSAWESTPEWARDQVNAYVAGINAFIADRHGSRWPPEFTILGARAEPFTGADVVVWVKMMAWDLSGNYSFELLRDDLIRVAGEEKLRQLMPPYPVNGLSIVSQSTITEDSEAQGGHRSLRKNTVSSGVPPVSSGVPPGSTVWPFFGAIGMAAGAPVTDFISANNREGLGSNNWVVDGTLSTTGKPLLANDPHLSAKLPSTWYLAHITGGDFDVIGATLPGTPAVAIGRNRRIAWGETNVAADVEDLFRERLDPTGRFAEFRGALEPITVVRETINVKNAAPIQLDVRITRHGPLVSDAENANAAETLRGPMPPAREPLAFRWTALDREDSSLVAFLKLNEAGNWNEFTSALRNFVVPSQNFVYADVDGHIGYYAPGRIPVRAGGDGSRPVPGWTGEAEWTGWVPFDELPHLFDPPEHFIVTANHRPAPANYRYNLGLEWVEPYRATRIIDLLREKQKYSVDDFARIQADTLSLHAVALLPALLDHVRPQSEPDRTAVELLRAWNKNASADSAGAAIFSAWFQRLASALAGDDIGAHALDSYSGRFTYITRFVLNTLATPDSPWCDDVRTPERETCDDTITAALHGSVVDLTSRLGGTMKQWRWDAVHRAVFPHQGLDAVAALRPLLSRSMPNGGDWSTVNVGPVAADQLYAQKTIAGYRQIIDLSPANDSRFIDAVGQSGHVLSNHYDDFLSDWQAVRHRKMRTDWQAIVDGAIGTLKLEPMNHKDHKDH